MTKLSLHLRYSFFGEGGVPPRMIQLSKSGWEIAGGVAAVAVLGAAAVWVFRRKRLSEEELERRRRQVLVQTGRIVDGMLLDIQEISDEEASNPVLLFFSYRIGGVDYECAQDVSALREIVEPSSVRVGFPCSVRYQPGNPQNSIVIAEGWSGLREGLTRFETLDSARRNERNRRQEST